MTMKDIITKKIEKNFPNAKFYIKDTSSKHVRHSQNNFKVESHFVINIISKPPINEFEILLCLNKLYSNLFSLKSLKTDP